MENKDEPLSHHQSFEIIEEMIYKAKSGYHESGISALLWGGIIMFCSVVSFANNYWKIDLLNRVWLLTILAVIPQIIISIRESKAQKFKSHTGDAMSGIWIGFGIAIFLTSYYTSVFKPEGSASLFLILYGLPTFATGYTHRFVPMIIGGAVCWACAIISFYTGKQLDLVLFFIAAFFAWFLPGIILRTDYLKEKKKNV